MLNTDFAEDYRGRTLRQAPYQRHVHECRSGPRRSDILRPLRQHRVLVRIDADRFRPRRRACSGGSVPWRTRVLQALKGAQITCH